MDPFEREQDIDRFTPPIAPSCLPCIRCPACETEYNAQDEPAEYDRVKLYQEEIRAQIMRIIHLRASVIEALNYLREGAPGRALEVLERANTEAQR